MNKAVDINQVVTMINNGLSKIPEVSVLSAGLCPKLPQNPYSSSAGIIKLDVPCFAQDYDDDGELIGSPQLTLTNVSGTRIKELYLVNYVENPGMLIYTYGNLYADYFEGDATFEDVDPRTYPYFNGDELADGGSEYVTFWDLGDGTEVDNIVKVSNFANNATINFLPDKPIENDDYGFKFQHVLIYTKFAGLMCKCEEPNNTIYYGFNIIEGLLEPSFLDATAQWSNPNTSSFKYLSAKGAWIAPDKNQKFLCADGTWKSIE